MAITREEVNPTYIPNTIMQKVLSDGVDYAYDIAPADGYVLHDNRCDEEIVDPVTLMPTGERLYRYATGSVLVAASYDFDTVIPGTIQDVNGNTLQVNMVGPFELFAAPASAIPENQTYGDVTPPVEVAAERSEPNV